MQSKARDYLNDCLTHHGFVVVDPKVAHQLNPLRWATASNAAMDFSADIGVLKAIATTRGAMLYEAQLDGLERATIPVLAVSLHQIRDRILWITGRRLKAISPWPEQAAGAAEQSTKREVPTIVDGELIPNYPCTRRSQLLERAGFTRDPLLERG